jgi:molecular chaperone DnaK
VSATPDQELALHPDQDFAGFVIKRRLGVGGMGEVWLARQVSMDRDVALKILSPKLTGTADFIDRFRQEVKLAGKLNHPNIVTAFHAGDESGLYFLAMEFVDGVGVGDRLRIDRFLPEKDALGITRQIAEALAYAWNKFHMLHRDIKPENIIVDGDGKARLMDMGISKTVDQKLGLTMPGAMIGTPYYMSPEQARGDVDLDARSDIYSLGSTLYHLVTGQVPYDAPTATAVLVKHITEPFPPPQKVNPAVSNACAGLLEAMMAKKPEGRQQTWEQVIRDIDLVLGGRAPDTRRPPPGESTIMPAQTRLISLADVRDAVAAAAPSHEKAKLRIGSPPAKTGINVGIDLGTTYSEIAYMTESGRVEVIPNNEGGLSTPSVVFFDDQEVLVGQEAARAALLEPDRMAACFKRNMGQDRYERKVNRQDMRPEALSAVVLKKLKQDAESKIGPIASAVITVPAYFDDTRRKATQDAARIAGLEVSAIINEPSAAAIWYCYQAGDQLKKDAKILIYDLGGGTFDVTLMRVVGPNEFVTIATDGEVKLGGKDWDARLIDHVAGEFVRQAGFDPREDDVAYQELVQRVEEAKRALSKRASVSVPLSYHGQSLRITIDRNMFRDMTSDLLLRTQTTMELLLAEVGLAWRDIDRVILVGGSSNMVMVREMIEKVSGHKPDSNLDLDLSVAFGAAVYSASLHARREPEGAVYHADVANRLIAMEHRNVNSHSLGIEIENPETCEPENHVIIPRNTPIPCRRSAVFGLSAATDAGGVNLAIDILEGEARNPEACIHIGTCRIENLPGGLPEGSPIEVTFSYSEDGRIHVSAVASDVGVEASVHLVPRHGLNDLRIDEQALSMTQLNIA